MWPPILILVLVSLCNVLLCLFSAPKKAVPVASDQFLISPITGEKIPVDKIQEHMRIGEKYTSLEPCIHVTIFYPVIQKWPIIVKHCVNE